MIGLDILTVASAAGGALALARRVRRRRAVPVMVGEALARLADGDTETRLPLARAGRDSRVASLFNALAAALAQTGDRLPPGGSSDRDEGQGTDLLCVAVISVDRFVQLRHQIGSEVARRVLQLLQARIAEALPAAALGRIGRSTLELALPIANESAAETALAQLQVALDQPITVDGQQLELTSTIGFACGGRDALGEIALLEHAEVALDRALASNRRIAIFRAEHDAEVEDRLALARELSGAAERGEFFLCYQPKLSCREDTICSVEALIRWRHPSRGLIGPNLFIPIAENTGAIRSLTRWVLTQAIADQKQLASEGHPLEVSINISGRLLGEPDFAQWALEQCASAAAPIAFEITETLVIEDPTRAVEHLQAFADAGIRISIDDYGSGLSSLAYLKQLPAQELKIDRLFISGLASSHRDPLLVRSTIDLAHALDMQVTAEGVDNPATLALLRMMGCDQAQGFLIAQPLVLADLCDFLRNWERGRSAQKGVANPFGRGFWGEGVGAS